MIRLIDHSRIVLGIAIVLVLMGDLYGDSALVIQTGGKRSEVCCRCPGHGELFDVRVNASDVIAEHRCEKCETREREERNNFAQAIILNIAQFVQGVAMLASSGKEADDKLKAEQCLIMAQAVGNILYHTHEHHRLAEMKEGASLDDVKKAFNPKTYEELYDVMLDLVMNNPDYCANMLKLATP